jgi:hypothetical protein
MKYVSALFGELAYIIDYFRFKYYQYLSYDKPFSFLFCNYQNIDNWKASPIRLGGTGIHLGNVFGPFFHKSHALRWDRSVRYPQETDHSHCAAHIYAVSNKLPGGICFQAIITFGSVF